MNQDVYGPIITGLVTVIFGWHLVSGLGRGEVEWPTGQFSSARRHEQPVKFWFVTGCLLLLTATLLLGTLAWVFFPHRI